MNTIADSALDTSVDTTTRAWARYVPFSIAFAFFHFLRSASSDGS